MWEHVVCHIEGGTCVVNGWHDITWKAEESLFIAKANGLLSPSVSWNGFYGDTWDDLGFAVDEDDLVFDGIKVVAEIGLCHGRFIGFGIFPFGALGEYLGVREAWFG